MNQFRITLTTKSYILTGSGEGDALIDADVVFHPTGFPYIPGRRLKGLLRESLEETLEIYGKSDIEVLKTVQRLFGIGGTDGNEGLITVPNLYLKEWRIINEHLSHALSSKKYNRAFQPDFIKKYYTKEIQQTAINSATLTAKKRSLRNYRVLIPNLDFEGLLSLRTELNEDDKNWLVLAARNLRAVGTRRNRGFGKVECQIDAKYIPTSNSERNIERGKTNEKVIHFKGNVLSVQLTTLSPIVLALLHGDQNTVFTEKHISGNRLRGLLAEAFMKKYNLTKTTAHNNPDFFNIFLSGKVHFGSLYFKGIAPVPLYIHARKGHDIKEYPPLNVFEDTEQIHVTKPIGGYGKIDYRHEAAYIAHDDPSTTFFFHNSRVVRSAGKSTKDQTEGGIFYYEALDEGQIFWGQITSDDYNLLKQLYTLIDQEQSFQLGRSRSAQYGKVCLECLENISDYPSNIYNGDYLLILQSPLILLNEYGEASLTGDTLKKELKKRLKIDKGIDITQTAVNYTTVEQFNIVWQSKTGKYTAFKEGSVFRLRLSGLTESKMAPKYIGEWCSQGFGRVTWEPYNEKIKFLVSGQDSEDGLNLDEATLPFPLADILKKYNDHQIKISIKTRAINKACNPNNLNRLPNHLIGRLLILLNRASNYDEIKAWLNNIKDKPAENLLKGIGLFDDFYAFTININKNNLDFEHSKIYWQTYLQTLRKLNK